jgi:hypothetical protein
MSLSPKPSVLHSHAPSNRRVCSDAQDGCIFTDHSVGEEHEFAGIVMWHGGRPLLLLNKEIFGSTAGANSIFERLH